MLKNLWVSQKRQQASFPGDRPRGVVSRLFPYSNYKLEMVVVNGRGDGPRSETKEFTTPEGGRCDPQLFGVGQDPGSTSRRAWSSPQVTWPDITRRTLHDPEKLMSREPSGSCHSHSTPAPPGWPALTGHRVSREDLCRLLTAFQTGW